jgi:hypothetical protein
MRSSPAAPVHDEDVAVVDLGPLGLSHFREPAQRRGDTFAGTVVPRSMGPSPRRPADARKPSTGKRSRSAAAPVSSIRLRVPCREAFEDLASPGARRATSRSHSIRSPSLRSRAGQAAPAAADSTRDLHWTRPIRSSSV